MLWCLWVYVPVRTGDVQSGAALTTAYIIFCRSWVGGNRLHMLSCDFYTMHAASECTVYAYSTPGRRRTWGPASQAGVVLNFLDSSRFMFLSAVMKAVQRAHFIPRMLCRTMSFQICSFLQLFSPECSLKI